MVGKLDTGRATGTIVCRPLEKVSPMAVTAAQGDFRAETRLPSDYLPLLRWMIFTGVCLFGFVLAWHFGLIRMMLSSDKTYISVIILILYAAASVHCLVRTVTISRELSKAMRILALVRGGTHEYKVVGEDVVNGEGAMLPRGEVTTHIRNLIMKDKLQGDDAPARPDAAAAGARRRLARAEPARRLRQRFADEARPARHHHRLHHDARRRSPASMPPTTPRSRARWA